MLGLVGFGVVGQALYSSFKDEIAVIHSLEKQRDGILEHQNMMSHPSDMEYRPEGYDIYNSLKECKAIFICLPTPSIKNDGEYRQDFSAFEVFFNSLGEYNGLIIIKSTVLYTNIKPFLSKYRIVMNPEFLNANTAIEDFSQQESIILGGDIDDCMFAKYIYLYDANLEKENIEYLFCTVKEAIDIKYIHNIYHAYKVLFWNFCQAATGNTRKISDMYKRITGNENEMSTICADGKAGYGGTCFPKDVAAYRLYTGSNELLDYMINYNNKLRG